MCANVTIYNTVAVEEVNAISALSVHSFLNTFFLFYSSEKIKAKLPES